MNTTIAFVSAGMMIPELGPAGQALNCGGLEDLNGHIAEGCVKKGISVIPITYGYPIDWRTGDPVDYYTTPARFLFNLEVSVYYESRIIPIFGVNRAGATVYLINDPEAGILYPGDVGKKIKQTAFLGMAVPALLKDWRRAKHRLDARMDGRGDNHSHHDGRSDLRNNEVRVHHSHPFAWRDG